jgi:branched-chain amino acid transport system ATP-binding protein
MAMLEIRGLSKNFSGFQAINNIDFTLEEGARHAIIGPNGAGKTTFFNLITGHLDPSSGDVLFRGKSMIGLPPHAIVKKGIARSFQRINIYPRMTVSENVQVALIARDERHLNLWAPAHGLNEAETCDLLELVGLLDERDEIAGELAYGRQKQLELAISLASDPQVLLLDEPTAGMSPTETRESIQLVDRISKERNLTLLFTEHDMSVVFGIADQITVLHHGEIIASGSPDEVRNNRDVRSVYLGDAVEDATT